MNKKSTLETRPAKKRMTLFLDIIGDFFPLLSTQFFRLCADKVKSKKERKEKKERKRKKKNPKIFCCFLSEITA